MNQKNSFDIIKDDHSLCFRCEHRALWNETKTHRPRCECGSTYYIIKDKDGNCEEKSYSVHSCYMYEPVKPLVLEMNKGEKRPPFSDWIVSGRIHAVGLPETKMTMKIDKKKMVVYHVPCLKKK